VQRPAGAHTPGARDCINPVEDRRECEKHEKQPCIFVIRECFSVNSINAKEIRCAAVIELSVMTASAAQHMRPAWSAYRPCASQSHTTPA
jgi:hypothetical protein